MASGQGGSNKSDDLLWIAFGVIVAIVGIIYLMNKYYWVFNAVYGSIAWAHVYPVAMLGEWFPFLRSVPLLGTYLIEPCVQVNAFLADGNFSEMTFQGGDSARGYVMSAAGRVAFLVYAPFLVRAMLNETEVHVDQKYRRKHDLESMLHEQAKSFPTIRLFKHLNPIANRDLMPKDFAEGAMRQLNASKGKIGDLISGVKIMIRPSGFTRSINPEEWLVSNGLVLDPPTFKKLTSGLFPADDREFYFSEQWEHLSIASISEVLENQLVSAWTGPENLPPHLKALFAVMTLFYGYELKAGNAMLDELGKISERAVIEKTTVRNLIQKDAEMMAKIEKVIKSTPGQQMSQIAKGHAWVESALPTLLKMARFERGVLASASFLWLKNEDRAAWYILNATGNETVNVEAAGAMAHNRAEIDFKSPLYVPHVYQAARSILHDYLDCHPDRIAAKKRRREESRTLDEQVRLMAMDARKADEQMSIDYEDKE